jgi:8-oxo-dGTP diphosphatase
MQCFYAILPPKQSLFLARVKFAERGVADQPRSARQRETAVELLAGILHAGIFAMPLPYKIATLLYCFNEREEILLLERAREPNRGFWSPCGGKLKMDMGESPYACACREAGEEIGVSLAPSDLHLAGLISEHGYQGQTHWLMFLFEVKVKLKSLPPPHAEGRFAFFRREEIAGLKIPQTDREQIWPWFWQYRGGFFAAHCHCHADGRNDWTLEQG